MRNDLLNYFDRNNDYYIYMRENPSWHRKLTRNPNLLKEFLDEYKIKRRKRLVDKVEDLSMMISLAKELM